ncbi:MAG: hypothetical protein NW220_21160 [Leptolyngbyaceae cyanobacterium bins.349]|nr:hypothetical protein [Leptolyngbyaceae cyanobacterium bins.349]
MTDLPDRFHNYLSKNPARLAAELLHHYSFELAGYPIAQQVEIWLDHYPAEWLPIALIEALYQGRYKAISVEQILNLWQRRNHPVYHFNHEFERLICNTLPQVEPAVPAVAAIAAPQHPSPALSYRKILLELPSIRAASQLDRLSEIPPFKLVSRAAFLSTTGTTGTTGTTNSPERLAPVTTAAVDCSSLNGATHAGTTPIATGDSDREFKEFKEGVVFGLSSGLAVSTFKPHFRLALSQHYQPDWLAFLAPGMEPTAIAPFTPAPTPADPNLIKPVLTDH